MKVGVKVNSLDNLYDAIHAWANQKLLSHAGVDAVTVLEEIDQKSEKVGFMKRLTGNKERKLKGEQSALCEAFVKNYVAVADQMEGKVYDRLKFMFGILIVPENTIKEPQDTEEYYMSSIFMLNPWDYQEFLSRELSEKPYLFSFLEDYGLKKPEFIHAYAESKNLFHIFSGSREPLYRDAEYADPLSPEQVIDKVYHADFVITDSFLVLELAIVFDKEFFYLCGGKQEGTAALMLQQLGMSRNFIYDTDKKQLPLKKGQVGAKLTKIRGKVRRQLTEIFPDLTEDSMERLDCPTNILKTQCYGCLACKEVCPKNAIHMEQDREGFLYPFVNMDLCIRCGLCEKICIRNRQAYHEYQEGYPKAICAVNQSEEQRKGSSSGAIFPELSRYIIDEKKGAVVGVKFDQDMNPISDIAQTMQDVTAFYGSKYVKSSFDGIFPRIKRMLEDGRSVLYSGLPCECAGLRSYLRKEYDTLFVVEIMCHSVPSPKVFRMYLDYLEKKKKSKIIGVSFRDKSEGTQKMKFDFKNGKSMAVNYHKNNYFRAFYNDLIVRPSCGRCTFVYDHRVGDITLGDFWGVKKVYPDMAGYNGINMILLNTKKGEEMIKLLEDKFIWKEIKFSQAFIGNHSKSGVIKPERKQLFDKLTKVPINELLEQYNDTKQTEVKNTEKNANEKEKIKDAGDADNIDDASDAEDIVNIDSTEVKETIDNE